MNISFISEIFIKNMIFRVGNKFLSVKKPDDVLYAVKNGYKAMQPRTFDKIKDDAQIIEAQKEKMLKDLAQVFADYFTSPPVNFDDWHKDTCEKFLDDLNSLLKQSGYKSVAYGKAQKIVNVTFKNLYLFDDADQYSKLFEDCHFILDSANMEWYNTQVASVSVTTAWSNLDYPTYNQIQKEIKTYLSKQAQYPINPFEAEFSIWSDYWF